MLRNGETVIYQHSNYVITTALLSRSSSRDNNFCLLNKNYNFCFSCILAQIYVIWLQPKCRPSLVSQQVILKCQPWFSSSCHFVQCAVAHMQHLPLRRMECVLGNSLDHVCTLFPSQPYGARIFVPQSNYFQSCDLMSGLLSAHRDDEYKAMHSLFLFQKGKNQVCSLTTKLFNKAFSFQSEIGLGFWTKREVLWLSVQQILLEGGNFQRQMAFSLN